MSHVIQVKAREVKDEKTIEAIKDVLKLSSEDRTIEDRIVLLGHKKWAMRNEKNIASQSLFNAVQLIIWGLHE